MLLIYTYQITPRIHYIFDLIFRDILNLEFNITSDINEFNNFQDARLSYSKSRSSDETFIESNGFLSENIIKPKNIEVDDWNGTKMFFKTSEHSDIPFDIFAASFYLVTRYEEYLPFEPDNHKRFKAEDSLAYKNDFLQKPVINNWALFLKQIIQNKYPEIKFSGQTYKFISTFDLDNVFCYKGKSFLRNTGGALKSLLKFDFQRIAERIKVLSGRINDPFDHYEFHRKIQEQYEVPIIYFLLFAKKSRFDGAVSPASKAYQALIETLKKYAETGIHPSYYTVENPELLQSEVLRLAKALKKPVTKSRQHFLKLSFPTTYQNLVKAGITEDYSMGYQSHPGFRAGICTPYFFYDLETEAATNLKIFPFCIMDSMLYDYMKLGPGEAWQHIQSMVGEVKKVNGTLITIWHDRTFCNTGKYKGWKELFAETVKLAYKL